MPNDHRFQKPGDWWALTHDEPHAPFTWPRWSAHMILLCVCVAGLALVRDVGEPRRVDYVRVHNGGCR